MRKLNKQFGIIAALVMSAILLLATTAMAAPKEAGVQPSCDGAGNCTIPALPNGTLVKVVVWNDNDGTTNPLGATSSFKLKPGDGFNFTWKDCDGKVWWQMVTKSTQAAGLAIDPWVDPADGKVKCKYIFLGK
jgi:hypothetical protein